MSQYIVFGTRDTSADNISDVQIDGVANNSLLFVKNSYIAGLTAPTFGNCILQWDPNTEQYIWNKITLSTFTGSNETEKGVLWNSSDNTIQTMNATDGEYNITVKNDIYSLTPVEKGSNALHLAEGVEPGQIIIKSVMHNTLMGLSPQNGYLNYSNGEYSFHNPVKTTIDSGLVWWSGSEYRSVKSERSGWYAIDYTGSNLTNIASANGFVVASNKKLINVSYPTDPGNYKLNITNNGEIKWKKDPNIKHSVQSITISNPNINGNKIINFTASGDYIITVDLIAVIDVTKLPKGLTFEDYLRACPRFEIQNKAGQTLISKTFTGPQTYDYFSFTCLHEFYAGDYLKVVWENNVLNIVQIQDASTTVQYIDHEKEDYKNVSGSTVPENGIIDTITVNGMIMINLMMSYELVDVVETDEESEIEIDVGGVKTIIKAIPPTVTQYYSMCRTYAVRIGETISIKPNNNNIRIKNYNLIVKIVSED